MNRSVLSEAYVEAAASSAATPARGTKDASGGGNILDLFKHRFSGSSES